MLSKGSGKRCIPGSMPWRPRDKNPGYTLPRPGGDQMNHSGGHLKALVAQRFGDHPEDTCQL